MSAVLVCTAIPLMGADEAPLVPPPTPQSARPAPIISVDTIEHDFGDQWAGPPLNHTFTISNRGNAPLEIIEIRPQCGCTVAGTYPKTIAPGQSGQVPFTLVTLTVYDAFSKPITLRTNDPVTPQLVLRLKGKIKRRVEYTPTMATLGDVLGDKPKESVIRIRNNTEKPLQVTMRPFNHQRLRAELSEVTPGQEYALKVSTVVPHQTGPISGVILLETNVPEEKLIQISVVGRVPERLDVNPTTVIYGGVVTGGTATLVARTRWVHFTNNGEKPVKVIKAEVNDPAVAVTLLPIIGGKVWNIKLEFPEGYKVPTEGRTLTISTDDAEKPTMTCRIMGGFVPTTRPATQPVVQAPVKRPAEFMVGQFPPLFELTTLAGKRISTADLTNNLTVLNFVAPNCSYCKRQAPVVEGFRKLYEAKGVRFVNIAEKMGAAEFTAEQSAAVFKAAGAELDLAVDTQNAVGLRFKAVSYPTMFVIDRQGKIAHVNVGSNTAAQLGKQLDILLGAASQPAAQH